MGGRNFGLCFDNPCVGEVCDRYKIGEEGSPSTLAHAHPKILHAVLRMELIKAREIGEDDVRRLYERLGYPRP